MQSVEEVQPAALTSTSSPEQFLRALFYRGDMALIVRDAGAIANQPGASLESRAWYFSETIQQNSFDKALPVLDGMEKEAADDPWTLAAKAMLARDLELAIWLCERAVARSDRDDVLLLCARFLPLKVSENDKAKGVAQGEMLKAFLERYDKRFEGSADGLAAKGDVLRALCGKIDKSNANDATHYDKALEMDAHNIRALIGKLQCLEGTKQHKEACELIVNSPWAADSFKIHETYWGLISKREDLGKEEKARLIEADARQTLARLEPTSWPFTTVYGALVKVAPDCINSLFDLVQERYPNSRFEETAVMLRAFAKLGEVGMDDATPETRRQLIKELIALLDRPARTDPAVQGSAIHSLVRYVIQDKDSTPAQLEEMTKILARNDLVVKDYYADLVVELANRKANLEELARIAEMRIDQVTRSAVTRSAGWHFEQAERDVSNYLGSLACWYEALGWVKLKQGKADEAELKLVTAETLLNRMVGERAPGKTYLEMSPIALMHLGALYTAKGDYAKAEAYLNRSLSSGYRGKDEHPAVGGYKELYVRQHGSEEGFEKYMAAADGKEAERRKKLVLSERIADAMPIPPFELMTLDGETASSHALKGKVTVIKFWGVWCGFCVKELPEFQQFYEKYKDNPKVAVLAIDSKDTIETVKAFQEKEKYTFPVLLDSNYVPKSGVTGFPTIWFLDADGNKVFQRVGYSKHLLEEFSWRVEAMLADEAKPAQTVLAY